MIIDSSAIIAILQKEDECDAMSLAIHEADILLISTATVIEATTVMMNRLEQEGIDAVFELLTTAGAEIVPLTEQQMKAAITAMQTYGKGRHKASLNYGDCITYALAKSTSLPLLFKGNDFIHTDLDLITPESS